jgi:EpsI family protein
MAMLGTAILAVVLAPRQLPQGFVSIHVAKIIPRHFGTWSYVPGIGLITPAAAEEGDVDPKLTALSLYTQIVGRGYQDADGNIVMLMVAYGPVQDFRLKAHFPELCYIAAGFRISNKSEATMPYRDGVPPLRVTRLTAERGSRLEPISYWMRVGEQISRGVVDRQIIRLKYGLKGVVPDGVLIRVSTTGLAPEESFKLQRQFIRDLLAAIPPEDLPFFTGKT